MSNASDFVIKNGVLTEYKGPGGDVTIPDGVTAIGDIAFLLCKSLTSITIPDSVTAIGDSAFGYCSSLTSITISDSVTTIGKSAFSLCESLTSVIIPGSVTTIGDSAFSLCRSLTSIVIPDGVTTIGEEAFRYCESLTSVVIPDSVTAIGKWAFRGCEGLSDERGFVIIRGVMYDYFGKEKSVVIPDGVMTIGDSAFEDSSLTSVVIPDSASTIWDGAFDGCNSLASMTIPAAMAGRLSAILPKGKTPVIHGVGIADVSVKYRPGAAVGFAEDGRDCTDAIGKKYAAYIKSNAAKLAKAACEHPALLYLMVREKLITAKDLEAVTEAVQATGNAELTAVMLEYGAGSVSDKDKAKAKAKKEEREEKVTDFVFDTEKPEALSGKTIVVTGKLKTFASRDELKECLSAVGAVLSETLTAESDFLLTNTPNSGTAKNKKAEELGVRKITEAEFNSLVGRRAK